MLPPLYCLANSQSQMEDGTLRSLTRYFVAMLALALAPLAFAQAWPERPIRLIVNFAAGGSTDIIARSMATQLGEALGQPVVVENRVGAGGNIGLVAVARAAPDGHTLLHSSDGPILINPHLFKMEVDVARDLLPIAPTAGSALFLISRADLPARNMAEFVAYARANPGKLNYGSAGSGTLQHIAIEWIRDAAKFDAVHVPYKGSQAVLVDLLGGRVDFTMDLGAAIPHIKSGKLRLLAVPGKERSPIFPEAPTLTESGVEVEMGWISGIYAPPGTPAPIVTRLNKEIARIMQTPAAKKELDAMAAVPLPHMTPEEFAAHQQRARDHFGAIVRRAGITAN
jgi:tripartite-type tricarboxylate transporter receptor subunit TctC